MIPGSGNFLLDRWEEEQEVKDDICIDCGFKRCKCDKEDDD